MPKDVTTKKFCKLSSNVIDDQFETYLDLVSQPKFICLKCFRIARCKENLCKPKKVKKLLA